MQHQDRFHALDALRAFALLLGIFFHATMSFITSYATGLHWAVADSSQSMALLVPVGLTHVFRMSLFFFIAGFFAHLVYHRKGAEEFVRNRLLRIVVPFVVGWSAVAPLLAIIWRWGDGASLIAPIGSLWGTSADWANGEVRLTHLWFLYYLILIYVLIVGGRHLLADRLDEQGVLRRRFDEVICKAVEKNLAPLVLSIPVAIAAIFSDDWHGSMPTPDHSLYPELIPLVGYSTAFFGGWLLHRNLDLLTRFTAKLKSALYGLSIAGVLSTVIGFLTSLQLDYATTPLRSLSAFFSTATMWYLIWCLIGFALKKFSHPSARTRYIADASYWLYIAHLPVVCALQVWVAHWNLHWTIKYPFIMVISFAVLFASYHYLVRYTFIGAALNGRKNPRQALTNSALALN